MNTVPIKRIMNVNNRGKNTSKYLCLYLPFIKGLSTNKEPINDVIKKRLIGPT